MNPDLKDFLFILREYHAHRSGCRYGCPHMCAWSYAETVKNLRSSAAYMIGLGVNPDASPHEYK